MIPDLGRYAAEVLAAYVGSLALLALIVTLSVLRWRRLRAAIARAEAGPRG